MSTYAIADFFTRVRNAQMREARYVLVPKTNLTQKISTILSNEGFIEGVENVVTGKDGLQKESVFYLRLTLPILQVKNSQKVKPFSIKLISKPGCRIYVSAKSIPFPRKGMSLCLISTSKGIVTNHEAQNLGIGGEFLCMLW